MINLVYSRRVESPSLKALAACWADKADDNGEGIRLSVPTMADETGLGESTVRRLIAEGKTEDRKKTRDPLWGEMGLWPIGNGGSVKVYAFNLPAWFALPVVKSHERHLERYEWARTANPLSLREAPPAASGTPSRSERNSLPQRDPIPLEPLFNPIAAAAIKFWNELADQNERKAIKRLSDKRQQGLLSAIDHVGGIDAWKEAVTAIGASDWIKGAKPQGFDFDGLIAKPDKLIGLIEGKYKDHADAPKETYADYVLRNTRARSPEELEAARQRLIARGELPKDEGGNFLDHCLRKYGISTTDKRDDHPLIGPC